MMLEFSSIQSWLLSASLCAVRASIVLLVLPFSGSSILVAPARIAIALSLSMPVIPTVAQDVFYASISGTHLVLIGAKECLIGLIVGFVLAVPFWVMQSVGTLLDNQTGANNASIFDPMTGHEGGVTPAILLQFTIAAVFAAGGFVLIVDLLYFSYTIWPIKTMLPLTGGNWAEILIKLSTEFWRWIVVYGAPLVGSLILLELGLALISRGAPSLDLFSFSLPAKSFFAYLVLYLMCSVLVQAFVGIFSENGPVRFYLQRFVSNG